eukprot:SAG11_NODE_2435_length_3365_cov_3.390386_1_plen_434_part_00
MSSTQDQEAEMPGARDAVSSASPTSAGGGKRPAPPSPDAHDRPDAGTREAVLLQQMREAAAAAERRHAQSMAAMAATMQTMNGQIAQVMQQNSVIMQALQTTMSATSRGNGESAQAGAQAQTAAPSPAAAAAAGAVPSTQPGEEIETEIPAVKELLDKFEVDTRRLLRKANAAHEAAERCTKLEVSEDPTVPLPEGAPKSSLPKPPTLHFPSELEGDEAAEAASLAALRAHRAYVIVLIRQIGAAKALVRDKHRSRLEELGKQFESDVNALFKTSLIPRDLVSAYKAQAMTLVETERIQWEIKKQNRKEELAAAKMQALQQTDERSLGKLWDRKMEMWAADKDIQPMVQPHQRAEDSDDEEESAREKLELNAEMDKTVMALSKNGKGASQPARRAQQKQNQGNRMSQPKQKTTGKGKANGQRKNKRGGANTAQ